MSSKRRIESSRANGAKSRGPVTPAGRVKSSRNNLRHGLLAGIVVLEDEKADAFTDLVATLTREINPQTEAQRALVETMAVARWRQMRLWVIERNTLQSEMEKHEQDFDDPAPALSLAFRGLADQSRTLDLLNRYESRFDRQFVRSLNLLMKLARPDNPLTQFCHTNPVPQSDTQPTSPEETETNIRWGTPGTASVVVIPPSVVPPAALASPPDLPAAPPAPKAPDPRPEVLDPRPEAPDPRPEAPDPRPEVLDSRPEVLDPRPEAPDPRPEAPDPRPEALDPSRRRPTPGRRRPRPYLESS